MTSPRNNKHMIFIKTPFICTLGGHRGTGPMPLRFCTGYLPIFRQKGARKQNSCFLAQCILSLFTSRSTGPAEGILRPWSSPFLPHLLRPNLLRPKIQVHFIILKLDCIGEVFSPRPCLKNTIVLCYFNKMAIAAIYTNAKNEMSSLS